MKVTNISKRIFLFGIISLFCCSCASKSGGGSPFYFASYKTAEPVKQRVYFDEEYFSLPASEYQTHLATASACLALAGFSATINDYKHCGDNAKKFFNTLGFDSYTVNEFGNIQPSAHSFGVYLAKKTIGDYTLIGVTVRGAGYQMEWASNVSIGDSQGMDYDDDFADGFEEAADIYITSLKDFIASKNISGKIKLWTAGYSRGGAGVNLATGKLDDALVKNQEVIPGVSYSKDDIYAYCFEPPAGKVFNPNEDVIKYKGENYNNIHCILNLNDVVPFVAPKEFGFIRYGIDHYLPDIVTDLNYSAHINRVKKLIEKLPNYSIIGDYQIDKFIKKSSLSPKSTAADPKKRNWTLGMYLKTFIHALADAMGGREGYATNFEYPISKLFQIFFKNGSPKDSLIDVGIKLAERLMLYDPDEIVLDDLINNQSRFFQDLRPLLRNALERSGVVETIDLEEVIELIKAALNAVLKLVSNTGLDVVPSLFYKGNIAALASAHYPELLLCHMKALDDNYSDGTLNTLRNDYIKIVVSKDGTHSLRLNGTLLGSYSNNIFGSSLTAEETNNSFIYYLESDQPYTISCGTGDISVQVYEVSPSYVDDQLLLDVVVTSDQGEISL